MGGPMAAHIREAGFELAVFDVVAQAMEGFREHGAHIASSPREVADRAEIVFACVPSPQASKAVALGDDGVIHGKAISVYLECSTIGPDYMAELAQGFSGSRISLVDAPISGGVAGAAQGTLSVVASGDPASLERSRPALETFARNVFRVADEPGPAQVAKLINNMLSTTGTIAAFEGMVLGAKAGLDVEVLLDFINVSTGRNVATMQKIPDSILTRRFGGNIKIGTKDLGLYIKQAEKLGIAPYMAPRALQVFADAIAGGYDKETMRIVEFLEKRAGEGVVVQGKPESK
ncbi:NAD(P)-dependent oxidoreductase [Pigmentiphaga soli]|uniref:NAD(P)-dependent oxidoreductase n=2 Tax=Pigmentiphaga soli TaxID=1007095 RepID=A0ABP8HGX5_9BURK